MAAEKQNLGNSASAERNGDGRPVSGQRQPNGSGGLSFNYLFAGESDRQDHGGESYGDHHSQQNQLLPLRIESLAILLGFLLFFVLYPLVAEQRLAVLMHLSHIITNNPS
jgi:hypothetical protein